MPFWIWLILGFVLLSFLGMFAATWPIAKKVYHNILCLLYTSPSPRDA